MKSCRWVASVSGCLPAAKRMRLLSRNAFRTEPTKRPEHTQSRPADEGANRRRTLVGSENELLTPRMMGVIPGIEAIKPRRHRGSRRGCAVGESATTVAG